MYQIKQGRRKNGRWSNKERDLFFLWGDRPGVWSMSKDLLLAIFLINAFIGSAQHVEVAELFKSDPLVFVQEQRLMPVQAAEVPEEAKTVLNVNNSVSGHIEGVADKVFILESSGGKNDSCRDKGLYNGYGYGQSKHSWLCFKTQAEARAKVTAWFERELKKRELSEALCGYNLGFKSENLKDCMSQSAEYPYYRNYLAL